MLLFIPTPFKLMQLTLCRVLPCDQHLTCGVDKQHKPYLIAGIPIPIKVVDCIAPFCHVMHIMSMPIFYRCIKYCIRCLLLVFCFFADKTLSWCEIRQVLRMVSLRCFSGEHPLLSLVVASYLSALPSYSSLMFTMLQYIDPICM